MTSETHAGYIQEIDRLRTQKHAIILAHNYQLPEVQDIADFRGDSLELSRISARLEAEVIVFCGVLFMAETAKILSPGKKVLLPVREAGCPLADKITADDVEILKRQHPDAGVVTYVNSSAEVKALSDICCTSGNAVSVVKNAPFKKIIFIPDKNLAWWVARQVPEKEIIPWTGFCPVHEQYTVDDVAAARSAYPGAELIAHPECGSEVLARADFVASTAGMLKRARESQAKEFIVGTEEGFIYRLQKENPAKKFYPLAPGHICEDMRRTTLRAVRESLDKEMPAVTLDRDVIAAARRSLDEMIKYV